MKLSIWQQFSSNHSSGFTVVGEFATHAEAETAAEKIREILKNLKDWHTRHEEEMENWWSSGDWVDDPSPPEKELAQQYSITWRGAIDWFWNARVDIVLDRLLYITPGQRPEADGQPFDQLINRLGGKGYHEGDIYGDATGWILFNLTCQAPDENTTAAIYKRYLGFNRRIKRDGTHLHFYRWRFDEHPELPKLITALKTYACTEIEYNFEQLVPDRDAILYEADDLEVLIDVLNNVIDTEDRGMAAEALGEIGDTRAVEPLINALKSSSIRHSAVRALGNLRDQRAVDPLLGLLVDTDSNTKSWVIEALGKINDPRVIRPLINQLNDQRRWQEIVDVLGRIGAPVLEPLREAHENASLKEREHIETALQLVQDTVLYGKLLTDMRNENEAIAQNAFERAQVAGDTEAMLAFLRNPGTNWRSALPNQVIDALIERNDERLVPLLMDRFSYYGQNAINAFTKIGAPAVDSLIHLAENHSESWVRYSALLGLSNIGDFRAFDLLVKTLDTPDNMQRRIAAVGLGKIGDTRAIQPLIESYFRSEERWHPEVENAVLQAIESLGGRFEFVDVLIAQLQISRRMLGGIIYQLGNLGDKRAIQPLTNLIGTVDKRTQTIIEEALSKLNHSNST